MGWRADREARSAEADPARKLGGRPRLLVLSDDGAENPLDDPTGKGGELDITVHGTLFSTGTIRDWGAPELSFYLAAMIGEGFDRGRVRSRRRIAPAGESGSELSTGLRIRSIGGPRAISVSRSLWRRLSGGLHALRKQNFVATTTIRQDPVTKRRFERPRNLYRNLFYTLEWNDVAKQAEIRHFLVALGGDSELLLEGLPLEIGGGTPTQSTTGAEASASSKPPTPPA